MNTVFDTIEDFQNALQNALAIARQGPVAERVSCAMTFSSDAIIPIDLSSQGAPSPPPRATADDGLSKTVRELCNLSIQDERQKWQRGAARGIISAIREVDGYKYCVNNIWTSKDDDGYRFSYTCLDSLENKDRQANSLRRQRQSLEPAEVGRVRKETYDCRGQLSVKFSGARKLVEVVYKHTAVHQTVAERAPPARVQRKERLNDFDSPDLSYTDFDRSFGDAATDFARSISSGGPSLTQASGPPAHPFATPLREPNAAYDAPSILTPNGYSSKKNTEQVKRPRGRPRKIDQTPSSAAPSAPSGPPSLLELLLKSAAEGRKPPEIPGASYHIPPAGQPAFNPVNAGHMNTSTSYAYPPQPPYSNTAAPPPPVPIYNHTSAPPPLAPQASMMQSQSRSATQPVAKRPRLDTPGSASQHSSSAQASAPREPSPDPWFPSR